MKDEEKNIKCDSKKEFENPQKSNKEISTNENIENIKPSNGFEGNTKINSENYINNELDISAEKDLNKIGELLISAGADINAKDIIYQNII